MKTIIQQRGVATAELTLALFFLIALVFIYLEYASIFVVHERNTYAAYMGERARVVGGDTASVVNTLKGENVSAGANGTRVWEWLDLPVDLAKPWRSNGRYFEVAREVRMPGEPSDTGDNAWMNQPTTTVAGPATSPPCDTGFSRHLKDSCGSAGGGGIGSGSSSSGGGIGSSSGSSSGGGIPGFPMPGPGGTGNPTQCTVEVAAGGPNTGWQGAGNPINVIWGNKYQRDEDLKLRAPSKLEWVRHYNSQTNIDPKHSPQGLGWQHSYQALVADAYTVTNSITTSAAPKTLVIHQSDGRFVNFIYDDKDVAGIDYIGVARADGRVRVEANHIVWHWNSGRQLRFDRQGLLSRIRFIDGDIVSLHYNQQYQLVSVEDNHNQSLDIRYDDQGRIVRVDSGKFDRVTFSYDAHHNLVSATDAADNQRHYQYADPHDPHNLTAITDGKGTLHAEYAYDDADRAISSRHQDDIGAVTLTYHDAYTEVVNSQGESTQFFWEKRERIGLITEVTGAGCTNCGDVGVRYEYGDQFELLTKTQSDGLAYAYVYDDRGRVLEVRQSDAKGTPSVFAKYQYQGTSAQPSVIERPSVVPGQTQRVELTYTTSGRVRSAIQKGFAPTGENDYKPIERRLRFAYDKYDRLIGIDGPREDVEDHLLLGYNNDGRVTQVAQGGRDIFTAIQYDAAGRPVQVKRPEGMPYLLDYDLNGQVTRISRGQRANLYDYDASDNLVRQRSHDGELIELQHDADGRVSQVAGRDDNAINFRIDLEHNTEGELTASRQMANGQVSQSYYEDEHTGGGHTKTMVFDDALGLETIATTPAGDTVYHYADGNLLHARYRENPSLLQLPPSLDQNQQHDVLNDPTAGQSHLIALTDENGNETQFVSDDFGRAVARVHTDHGVTWYQYDQADNIIRETNAQGEVTLHEYDASNRLIATTVNGERVTIGYTGHLVSSTSNSHEKEQLAFHPDGQLATYRQTIADRELITQFDYDEKTGLLNAKRLPDGSTLHYGYHEDGQLKSMAITRAGGTQRTSIVDDIAQDNRAYYTYGNGVAYEKNVSPEGQLQSLRHRGSGETILDIDYGYNGQGQLTQQVVNGNTWDYGYDERGRLALAKAEGESYRYSFDASGNRTRLDTARGGQETITIYGYDSQSNRLTAIDGQTVEYTATGRPKNIIERRYEYDARGRIAKLYVKNRLRAAYAYNQYGERVHKRLYNDASADDTDATAVDVYYAYDDRGRLSQELNATGEFTAQYVYLDDSYTPIAKITPDQVIYLHHDHLGKPESATNSAGELVWRAHYQPYGKALVDNDPDNDGQVTTINLRLPGQYFDEESGTHYNYQRTYDPNLGRYLTPDPIGLQGGVNQFAYAGNQPHLEVDPRGEAVSGIAATIAKIAAKKKALREVRDHIRDQVLRQARKIKDKRVQKKVFDDIDKLLTALDALDGLSVWDIVGLLPGGIGVACNSARIAAFLKDVKDIASRSKALEKTIDRVIKSKMSYGEFFENRVAKTFKKKILRRNEKLYDKYGNVVGEIDFETAEALVEVGASLGDKAGQLHRLAREAAKRNKRLDIFYDPSETPPGRLKMLRESLRKKWGNRVRFIPHG